MHAQILITLVAMALLLCFQEPFAYASADGSRLFQQKCTACHTIGGGKLVGPDLSGVSERRDDAWLKRQIKEPDKLVAEGDSTAVQLVKDFGIQMPALGLSDAEVDALVAHLKGGGVQQQAVGVPSQYLPTLGIGVLAAIGFTLYGLMAGKKQVDVR